MGKQRTAADEEAKKRDEELWGITNDQKEYKKWSEMTKMERFKSVFSTLIKIILVLGFLYLFVCSLSVMGSAFQILAGKTALTIFGQNSVLANPVAGLIIGVLVTVLVQSSSTSTSIVTTMVGAGIIKVHNAIPIIMGANIGTSVTNTIVSLMQSVDVTQFRRAFAGATVHDIFNLLSVLILLPIEVVSGYLERMTLALVQYMLKDYSKQVDSPDILKKITNPLTKKIVQIDKGVIKAIARGENISDDRSILKLNCYEVTNLIPISDYTNTSQIMADTTQVTAYTNVSYIYNNSTGEALSNAITGTSKVCVRKGLFGGSPISDEAVGGILLVLSLVALCVCLLMVVRILHSLLKGGVAKIIKKVINANFPYPFGWLTGYLAIIVGAGLTFVVQSSSVFTSTLTPLVGVGVISLKRMYPLTLGSNIGTTTTSILAALTTTGSKLQDTLQIAFCHFFFNITGILIWYPIPQLRRIPIKAAKFLGNTTAKYRWFAVFYLIFVFFLIPVMIFALSLIKPLWIMGGILIAVGAILVSITILKVLQAKAPDSLPLRLRNMKFLPKFLRSLEPYDRVIMKLFGWCKCCMKIQQNHDKSGDNMALENLDRANGHDNHAYDKGTSSDHTVV